MTDQHPVSDYKSFRVKHLVDFEVADLHVMGPLALVGVGTFCVATNRYHNVLIGSQALPSAVKQRNTSDRLLGLDGPEQNPTGTRLER